MMSSGVAWVGDAAVRAVLGIGNFDATVGLVVADARVEAKRHILGDNSLERRPQCGGDVGLRFGRVLVGVTSARETLRVRGDADRVPLHDVVVLDHALALDESNVAVVEAVPMFASAVRRSLWSALKSTPMRASCAASTEGSALQLVWVAAMLELGLGLCWLESLVVDWLASLVVGRGDKTSNRLPYISSRWSS
jgi:hypothetical protein